MADEHHHVSDELNDHKTKIETWADSVSKLTTPTSCQGVNDRFVSDCKTLIGYLENATDPSSSDLCDFDDRTAALEVQYHQITERHS